MERIRLENLTKIYDRHPVVADFSLSVSAGDFCVILGPSGSGKSSVMNMIGGFTAPTSGEIYIDGEPATGLPPHARDLGMMFQGYALFPHLTVFENVAFPLRARGVRSGELRARVERTLEVVELSDLQGRRPNELSGGQQQRTALARALVFGPRVLLMDEPLAALDRRLRERMQLEIKAIQRQLAITVLYITHDQQEAMMLADMLVVMNQGRAEQVGAPLSVYHRPRTRFVCDFLGDSNIFDATVESIAPGAIVCRAHSGERIIVTAEQPMAIEQLITIAVRPEHIRISAADRPESNLIPGVIAEILDLGLSRRYRVATPISPRPLLVTEPGSAVATSRKVHDVVHVAFAIEAATVISGSA